MSNKMDNLKEQWVNVILDQELTMPKSNSPGSCDTLHLK